MDVQLYWYIALISSGVLGVVVLLNIFGFDIDEVDVDIGIGDAFSLNSLIAFTCVGSWTGFLANKMTAFPPWLVLLISIVAGLSAYVGSILILRKLKGWESKGNINLENAIGSVGVVYLSIPGHKKGKGQIQIEIQGRLVTENAMTQGNKLVTGTKILVYDVEKNTLLVEAYNET
ncbi:MAG: hypothetical protein OEX02_16690 [Cyclobacteriaceae bacterium]|nr:hypothetical protein [Cyclobacteriaceae bacterium]